MMIDNYRQSRTFWQQAVDNIVFSFDMFVFDTISFAFGAVLHTVRLALLPFTVRLQIAGGAVMCKEFDE